MRCKKSNYDWYYGITCTYTCRTVPYLINFATELVKAIHANKKPRSFLRGFYFSVTLT